MTKLKFNINSPKQLGVVLFEHLKLAVGKKGKIGYTTNAETLENLKDFHPAVSKILEFRALSKLKSTFCDGLLKLIDKNNRIHTSFSQIETRTGRISSAEPNLQNIPVRTDEGRIFRKFFCAKKGHVLIDADYSQIELRVLAHVSCDKNMVEAFINGSDIHTITASQIFDVPIQNVTEKMRQRAKTVNFGIIYGMGVFSLAKNLKVKHYTAKKYLETYLAHYFGIDVYMKNAINSAKEKGFAETIFHRRRYLPELISSNHTIRAFGERVARNMPIQGTAADIIKIAMANIYKKIKKMRLKSVLILQIHDELILEAPLDEETIAKNLLEDEMKNAANLLVPLEVHIASGKTWYDTKN
jgi:DNA polymerase-1